jgi:Heavy-metal resistance
MSDTTQIPKRSKWWQALLIGSLALNLLVGGAVVTRMVTHGGPDRLMGVSYTQLIPRRFFAEMPRERRRVLLDILKKYRDDFRGDRDASGQVAVKLAEAIVIEPYDVEKVKLVVNEFTSQNGKLAARGGDAALDILSVLTPEERQLLASTIRDRASKKK